MGRRGRLSPGRLSPGPTPAAHTARRLGFRRLAGNDRAQSGQRLSPKLPSLGSGSTSEHRTPGRPHRAERRRTRSACRGAAALAAIRSLPDAYRETLILRLVEGMTGPEIAARTGLTPASVRVNLHRGMKQLREKLGTVPKEERS